MHYNFISINMNQTRIHTDFLGVSKEYLEFLRLIGFIIGECWLNISPSIRVLNPGGSESCDYTINNSLKKKLNK